MTTTSRRRRSAARTVSASAEHRELIERLALEHVTASRLALRAFGLTDEQFNRITRLAKHLDEVPCVSGPLLRDTRGLGAILLDWSREPRFLDRNGKPRVLSIRGTGSTFESLARLHLPHISLNRVIEMACSRGEVMKRPRGLIALVGGVLVKFPADNDALNLANAVRQIDQLFSTILHNRGLKRRSDHKRLERHVISVVPGGEVAGFMQEFVAGISSLLSRMDASLTRRRPIDKRALKAAAAVSVSIFLSEERNLERAGVDAMHLVRPARRGSKP